MQFYVRETEPSDVDVGFVRFYTDIRDLSEILVTIPERGWSTSDIEDSERAFSELGIELRTERVSSARTNDETLEPGIDPGQLEKSVQPPALRQLKTLR
jgi:hypothetical protein